MKARCPQPLYTSAFSAPSSQLLTPSPLLICQTWALSRQEDTANTYRMSHTSGQERVFEANCWGLTKKGTGCPHAHQRRCQKHEFNSLVSQVEEQLTQGQSSCQQQGMCSDLWHFPSQRNCARLPGDMHL